MADDLDDRFILDGAYPPDALDGNPDGIKGIRKRKRPEKPSHQVAVGAPIYTHKKHKPTADPICQSPEALAQLLQRTLVKAFPKLSDLERDDLRIPESALVDTTAFATQRTHATLTDFVTTTCPTLAARIAQRPKHRAAPTAIVLAGAALRVADLTRALRPLKGESGGEIAKVCYLALARALTDEASPGLFARHFKLKDHVAYLAKTRVGVAVGTPARISQLLAEPDALSVKALSHIILDFTHLDTKQRSLLDIPETRVDTLRGVLGDARIRERLINGKTKLVFF
ncbi:U3 containing 90S pre-ribosomal complex subunit [Ceratobasidium theobromae]|uniref:U3 containing 90S pre-ribosomal complex subunit n=1 Tax=Ceratobasidium theobromae TaxID=1582974 RepID=A0A5N5QUF5_9AGAM|nr:U3 containing 90S pre-ribosomal complex subunit [Ceratobasidium theobromae]